MIFLIVLTTAADRAESMGWLTLTKSVGFDSYLMFYIV
jgi:hypothetical protein